MTTYLYFALFCIFSALRCTVNGVSDKSTLNENLDRDTHVPTGGNYDIGKSQDVINQDNDEEVPRLRKSVTYNSDDHEKGHLLNLDNVIPILSDDKRNAGFIHAFLASFAIIIVSEIGDKTFFIAAIMAMKYRRTTVFAGAAVALATMTALSAFLGWTVTIIPRYVTHYCSVVLFAAFGLKLIYESRSMAADEAQEEFEEVQAELKKKDETILNESKPVVSEDVETGVLIIKRRKLYSFVSPVFVQALTLTFLAEWGDRSQIATILLAAREDSYKDILAVCVGGTLGHLICTGIAVIGGRIVSQKISAKTVTFIGGVVFLLFSITALMFDN